MLDEDHRKSLGAFVRARRESITPDVPGRRRRTPGLRREELAARAGIGVTWVAWIEQGREVRASAETLARLADGLSLTRAERAYLFTLAARHDPADPFATRPTEAPAAVTALVQGLNWPAYGLDAAWTVCCANAAARRLFVGLFDAGEQPNLLRYIFTAAQARARVVQHGPKHHQPVAPAQLRGVVLRLGCGRGSAENSWHAAVLRSSGPWRPAR